MGVQLRDFEALLFDVDGTLIDSLDVIVQGLGDTLEAYVGRRPSREEILSLTGMPLRVLLARCIDAPLDSPDIESMATFAMARFEAHEHLERPYAAAVHTLELAHRQGIRTALVTSKSRRELDSFLKRFEPARYVDALVCASDVELPKPHPESARKACSLLGVSPERAAMIGDSIFDIRCAQGAGLTAIAVGYGAGDAEILLRESPNLFFPTPEALLEWAQTAETPEPCPVRS